MPARRLLLDPAPLRAALHRTGLEGALPTELLDGGDPAVAGAPLHPAVLTALALLARSDLPRVVVRAGTSARRRLTVLAADGGLGTSLARDLDAPEPQRPVEQSVFPDAELGAELARCLPPLPVSDARRPDAPALDPALLLLATAPGADPADPALGRTGGWSEAGIAAVAALGEGISGSVEVTVSASLVVSRLLWVHAGGAWWQVVPTADAGGRRSLDVLAVEPADLPGALAPLLAGALAESLAQAR